MMPRVLNKHRHPVTPGCINIMRPNPLGNPFVIGVHGTHAEVIAQHRVWLPTQPKLMAFVRAARGCDLMCCCAPAACHGDFILELANAPRPNVLARITAPHFVAGLEFTASGECVLAAPILQWAVGKSARDVHAYCQGKAWAIERAPV